MKPTPGFDLNESVSNYSHEIALETVELTDIFNRWLTYLKAPPAPQTTIFHNHMNPKFILSITELSEYISHSLIKIIISSIFIDKRKQGLESK